MGVVNSVGDFLNRARYAWRNGVQFRGSRDLYEIFGYKRMPEHMDYVGKYLRQDITSRIINAPVDAVWSDPPELRSNAKIVTEWTDLIKSCDLYTHLRKADIFAGLGAYSILIVGFDDGRELSEPVKTSRRNSIIYLQPYLEGSIQITKFEEDQRSPRFGKPILYEVIPGEVQTSRLSASTTLMARKKFTVHYSRVLHLADNTLENGVFGHSRLEPIYNTLDDLLKVVGGSAETYWLTANRGMQIDIDKEMTLTDEDEKNLNEEIEEYQHQIRRVMRTRGVKITNLGSDIADPKSEFGVLISLLAANTGIPQRVMLGAEAGQLASQQDRANWAVHVSQRIANWAEPRILKPFIRLILEANVIKLPENYEILWPEPFKMNPLERAQTSAQMARSAINVTRALQVQQEIKTDVMSVEEARSIIAPGDRMPIFLDTPKGTLPPPIETVDPQKFILDKPSNSNDTSSSSPPAPDPDMKRPEETRGVNE